MPTHDYIHDHKTNRLRRSSQRLRQYSRVLPRPPVARVIRAASRQQYRSNSQTKIESTEMAACYAVAKDKDGRDRHISAAYQHDRFTSKSGRSAQWRGESALCQEQSSRCRWRSRPQHQ